jgi:pimeloyl-ACP methyl ester carboxylesterase
MQFNTLQEIQRHLQSFSDPVEREIAEANIFFGAPPLPQQRKHVVVLLHGMNTNAEWQEALAEPIRNETAIEPLVVGYGNFHPVKFWLPAFFRFGRIKKVMTDLQGIRKRYPDADISIVAHSFGTYVLSRILMKATSLKLHRILLCGAIVSTDYDWSAVVTRLTAPVLNDIGRRDMWPSMARSWSWGYGDSGCIGFQNSLVRDRHFDYAHSDFLTVDHMRQYWLPYLIDGRIVSSPYTLVREKMGILESCGRSFSWGHVILLLAAGWGVRQYGGMLWRMIA